MTDVVSISVLPSSGEDIRRSVGLWLPSRSVSSLFLTTAEGDGAWLFPFLPLQHCALGRQLIELPGTGINLCSCRHSGISVSGNRDLRLKLMLLGERGLLATSVLMVTVAHDPMIDPDTRFSGSFALTRKWVQSLTTPHLSTMRSYRFLVRLMASLWACVSMFFCESQCASRIMAAFKLRSDS